MSSFLRVLTDALKLHVTLIRIAYKVQESE